ncbi:MAG TPA: SDR family oxidoreductase [Solirubrobacteraceae bacterium]|jgi:enoyl-[acyl-carrier-protein] reductase (NADH)|nr:SDR family oxidoreductase [Solirubrobacteraceae bacterium]
MPETASMKEVFELKTSGMTYEQFQEHLARMTHPVRVMTLAEVADVAAFMASDKASGMSGTTVNLTMGSLDD